MNHTRLSLGRLATGIMLLTSLWGCSNEAPYAPEAAPVASLGSAGNQGQAVTTAVKDSGPAVEEVSSLVEFEVLLLTPNLANSTIQLMPLTGGSILTGHIDENTVLLGMQGEEVELADFQVCFRGYAKGDMINDTEMQLTSLQMLPF